MKKKILLIQNQISHYRIPVYNLLSQYYDLTVLYSFGKIDENAITFKTILIECKKKWKFFVYQKNIKRLCDDYDIVIAMMSPMWLNILSLCFYKKRKFKLIMWGIGVPASYKVHFDDKNKSMFLLKMMVKKSDATIFYSEYARQKYIDFNFDQQKLYVACNTVDVLNCKSLETKDEILFIGTLYKEKGVDRLINQYSALFDNFENNLIPKLRIVGDGPEYNDLENLIKIKNLGNHIILNGCVTDEKQIASFFSKALICISPNQAGLSVQKSLGYGVPFATSYDAFTGGEIFDIVDKPYGFLFNNDDELLEILKKTCTHKELLRNVGKDAQNFYNSYRTIRHMAQGVLDACNFVTEEKNED